MRYKGCLECQGIHGHHDLMIKSGQFGGYSRQAADSDFAAIPCDFCDDGYADEKMPFLKKCSVCKESRLKCCKACFGKSKCISCCYRL